MREMQIIVKSFRRFASLERFVRSVRLFYPNMEIIVADDSFEANPLSLPEVVKRVQQTANVQWVQLAFDTGLAAGRNRLVQESAAPILVLCDDDFVFTERTCLRKLRTLLQCADVAAGVVNEGGRILGSPGRFRFNEGDKKTLDVLPVDTKWREIGGIRYRRADMVLNFFAARRDILRKFPWDERFKITGEHLDFFLSLHISGIDVVYTPEVIVDHIRSPSPGYSPFRSRQAAFRPLLARKWGIARLPEYEPYTEEF